MKKVSKGYLNFKMNKVVNNNKETKLEKLQDTKDNEISKLSVLFTPSDWAIDSMADALGIEMISPGTAISCFNENYIKCFRNSDVKESYKFGKNNEYIKVVLENGDEYTFFSDTKNLIKVKKDGNLINLGEEGLQGLTDVICLSSLDEITSIDSVDNRIAITTEIGEIIYYNKETYELEGIKTSDYQFFNRPDYSGPGYLEDSGKYISFDKINQELNERHADIERIWVYGDSIKILSNNEYYIVDFDDGSLINSDSNDSMGTPDEQRLNYLKAIKKYGKNEWNTPYCYFGM